MSSPDLFISPAKRVFDYAKPAWKYEVSTSKGSYFIAHNNGGGKFTFLDLFVSPADVRGTGLGTRLVSAMTRLALEKSAANIEGVVTSQHTLKIFRRLFAEERLSFFDQGVHLPMVTEQAICSLERAEEYEDNLEHRELGVWTRVDLTGLNNRDLEKAKKAR